MDYKIRTKKDKLDSTGYIEIGPGKYSGKHWQEGFIFVWESAFGMAEGVVIKHFPDYDHFGMNDIPHDVGNLIVREWREAASKIKTCPPQEAHNVLNLNAVYRIKIGEEITKHRNSISSLLNELANNLEHFYKAELWACILGM